MDNVLKYKDFIGTVNFSAEDGVFYGKIEGIKSMVSFEGETVHDLEEDFKTTLIIAKGTILLRSNHTLAKLPSRLRPQNTAPLPQSPKTEAFLLMLLLRTLSVGNLQVEIL